MNMSTRVMWYVIIVKCTLFLVMNAEQPHKKFEYKYSFKPPYLAQKDGSIPFWEYGGNAIASSENIRVAPSLRSQKGAAWTKQQINFDWWEVDLVFRITGRGRIGADGLAFWYTTERGSYDGAVFGSSDKWNGLGIFFDSFDNDNKQNNPCIMAVLNDGSKTFDHTNDGTTQLLGGCLRDFRNKPYATRAKIEYYDNTLRLMFHGGMTNGEDFDECFRVENVSLPKNGFFGLSAATGGLADDHDVFHFLTTSLHPFYSAETHTVSIEDEAALRQEYQDYQRKLDQQKEEYHREHPDNSQDKHNLDDWFESDNQRELRQIFSGQSQMFDVLRELTTKIDDINGKQERTLNFITDIQAGDFYKSETKRIGKNTDIIQTIHRHEVESVLNNQNVIINAAQDVQTNLNEINAKIGNILHSLARAPTAQIQPLGYEYQPLVAEIRNDINIMKRDIALAYAKLSSAHIQCPSSNCVTTISFFIFMGIQLGILLGYYIYRENREAQAKKFY